MSCATIPGPRPAVHQANVTWIPGACDAHIHVFEGPSGPEYVQSPSYRSPEASLETYKKLASSLGLQRAVIVQPSVYGQDHSVLLRALAQDPVNLRGVAVIGLDTPTSDLERMHRAGVRGVRVNLVSPNQVVGLDALARLEEKITPYGWHLQLFLDFMTLRGAARILEARTVACVIDHFGHLQVDNPDHLPGLNELLAIAALPNVWFKFSGSYRLTPAAFPFENIGSIARRIFAVAPSRCVWGSDWPHPLCAEIPDDGELLDSLGRWFPRPEDQVAVLSRNPANLYGF